MYNAYYIQRADVMGSDVFIYTVQFPGTDIHEAVLPCLDGYTVYLDSRLGTEGRKKAYSHAVRHILRDDFGKDDVSRIELEAHGW